MATPVTPSKSDIYEEDIGYRSAVSEELLRKIAASVNAINHDATAPIGTVEMSYLPLSAFQELRSNAWIMLDGSDITSTDLGQFILNKGLAVGTVKVADMRGQVPIGVNNGRADGKQNTVVPGLALGAQMGDGVKHHDHPIQQQVSTNPLGSGYYRTILDNSFLGMEAQETGVLNSYSDTARVRTKPNSHQSQTTVNSVGVNWFIKVWNNAQP